MNVVMLVAGIMLILIGTCGLVWWGRTRRGTTAELTVHVRADDRPTHEQMTKAAERAAEVMQRHRAGRTDGTGWTPEMRAVLDASNAPYRKGEA